MALEAGRQARQNRTVRGPLLSPRLRMVAGLLPEGHRLIDIGTDHAHLPIHAVLEGHFLEAVAADLRVGPLESASRNIDRFGCAGQVRTEHANGLQGFRPEPGDVVVMAGMGGLEMVDILCEAPSNWPTLVLQPQKSATELRRHLVLSGYAIHREALCLDGGRLYLGIQAAYSPDETAAAPIDPADFYIGPALRREQPPLFEAYLRKQRVQVVHAMLRHPLLSVVLQTIDQLLLECEAEHGRSIVSDHLTGAVNGGEA